MALTVEWVQQLVDDAMRHGADAIDIDAFSAADQLRGCETKIVLGPTYGWPRGCWSQLVKYRGEWWKVGQTTLFDNVATGDGAYSPDDVRLTVDKLLGRTFYGVRLMRWADNVEGEEAVGALSFITRMTDG